MSRFKSRIEYVEIDGVGYRFDADLLPALEHVPRELWPLLLKPLDRDITARYNAWLKADARARAKRVKWVDEAVSLINQGHSRANVGRLLAAKSYGTAEQIARTLSKMIVKPAKKTMVVKQQAT